MHRIGSNMSRRVALIPEELVSAYQLQKPEIRVEEDIESLLEKSKLPDDMKVKLLGQLISRYHHTVHAPPKPVSVSLSKESNEPSEMMDEETSSENDAIMKDIILSTPRHYSKYIPMITEKLKSRQYSWNELGEMTYENKPIKGSKIVDFFSYIMRNLKYAQEPRHVNVFLKAIKEINIPRTWIANRKVLSELDDGIPSFDHQNYYDDSDFNIKADKNNKRKKKSLDYVDRKFKKGEKWIKY